MEVKALKVNHLTRNGYRLGLGITYRCIALLFLFPPSASCPVGLKVQSFHVQAWSHPLEEWGAPDLSTQALGIFVCLSASSPFRPSSPLWGKLVPGQGSIQTSVCACPSLSRLSLCNPVDCSLPGSSVHGIFEARTLEQVAVSSSRGSSPPWD